MSAGARRDQGSRSSPLHWFVPPKAAQETTGSFPNSAGGFQSIIIFLTVCSRERRPLLASDNSAQIIAEPWQPANFWRVGRHVILLDNVPLFSAPDTTPVDP